ncbi:hypothetical protein [Paracoccus sp. 22332]|uniref:hypothetical protein n=1 Tax=Paracoccus sp. 22332 TaxID=3453913 RepID=UPI003F83849E
MRSRLHLALAVATGLAAAPLAAQPVGQATASNPAPAIQRLAEGTLPIVPCPGAANQGCVEILFDGDVPPAACWTLPPFGDAAVTIETAQAGEIAGSTTRRMTILFQPLDQVPPATPATLRFGFPRPGARLSCDQTVVVQRPASVLALPADLDLGVLRLGPLGGVRGAGRVQAVFAAPGQPAIGPLRISSQADLHGTDRRGSPVPVRLDLPAGAAVTAGSFAELTVAPRQAGAFPALGPLSGQVWITAPQLVQPFALTIRATGQIGWLAICAMLVLGILLGWAVRHQILPRQLLARARLEAGEAFVAAKALRARQRDTVVARELNKVIAGQEQQVRSARDQDAVAKAVKDMTDALDARLKDADARRQALAGTIAPSLAALRGLPAVSELPAQPLDHWAEALETAQGMIEAGEIDRPRRLIETQAAQAERAALTALSDFAADAGAAIRDLDRWSRDAAIQAFAPLQAVRAGFLPPGDATPAATLTALRDAHDALRRAAAAAHPAIARHLRALAAGAANSGFPDPSARTEEILRDLDGTPVAALTRLAGLVQDYQRHARTAKLASFEDLADVKPSGVEAGTDSVPPLERRIEPPEPPVPTIETDPRLPVAGQELRIGLADLPAGHVARIWTPYGSARIGGRDDPPLTFRPPHPGLLPVQIVLADARGHVLSRHSTTLTVQPAPDRDIPVFQTEKDRADRLATAAAAVLALLSGAAVFSVVPLTSWWALLAPFLWGFFVNLNLPDAIQGLQSRRDAVFKTLNIG